jgi:hypothetical protein
VEMPLLCTLVSLLEASQLPTSGGAAGADIFHPASDHVFMNGRFVVALFGVAQSMFGGSLCTSPFLGRRVNATAGHAGYCFSMRVAATNIVGSVHWESSHTYNNSQYFCSFSLFQAH